MIVLLHGNPIDGINIYGPFDTNEDACDYGERLQGDYWVTSVIPSDWEIS